MPRLPAVVSPAPAPEPGVHLSLCTGLSGTWRRIVGIAESCQAVPSYFEIRDERDRALIYPAIARASGQAPPITAVDLASGRRGMFLDQPAPKAIPHVIVHESEYLRSAVEMLEETSPTKQHWIESINHLLK